MPLSLQTKLLRVIENWEIKPIGSEETRIDRRATARRNTAGTRKAWMKTASEAISIYRLNVIQIRLPDLKDRRDDIPLLIHHFLKLFSKKNFRQDLSISREAMDLLCAYDWPGNVRELENALERAAVLCSDGVIRPADLPRLDNIVPSRQAYPSSRRRLPLARESLEREFYIARPEADQRKDQG
jgi:DNA-binding NtrC family response regulator